MNVMVQSLRELSQIKLAAMAGTAIFLIGFFIFLALRISSPVMSPLYTNIPVEDGGIIVQQLEENGTPYELRAGGSQIIVPSEDVLRIRMQMAQQGLPSNGSIVGYELFDSDETLGTSNFVLNVNKLRALEGELARTISAFAKVDKARVHLVTPKRELFTRDRREPTASVALKLRGGNEPSREEIAAIRHVVATAVPGLKPQRITVVDNRGRLLAKGVDSESDPQVFAEEAEEFRVKYENRLRDRLERLLEQSVGFGNVKVTVNADIDFDRIVRNEETFDPEGQVARSIQGIAENERSNERNVDQNVTVENNLPDADPNNAGTLSQTEIERSEETTNFEISKEVVNHVKETGTVRRLSVAVLVDGTYATPELAEDASGEEQPAPIYTPRSEEELSQLEEVVRAAMGYDAERGDEVSVVTMQFVGDNTDIFEDGPLDWLKDDLKGILQTLMLGVVAILAIFMVIRPLVARAIESAEQAQEDELLTDEALDSPISSARLADLTGEDEDEDLINIDRINGQVKSSTYRKINELIDQHPEETVQIVRSWALDQE